MPSGATPFLFPSSSRKAVCSASDLRLPIRGWCWTFSLGPAARVFYLTDPYRINHRRQRSHRSRQKRRPLVVLDPGHGGREPGAANDSHGLVESQVALDLAELTASRLRAIMPRTRVMLDTRSTDVGLSLEERCALANAMEADAFVSIHLNASSEPVPKRRSDYVRARHDEQPAGAPTRRTRNGTRVAEVTGIQGLLAKHHRQQQAEGSLTLAGKIQRHTLKSGRSVLPKLSNRWCAAGHVLRLGWRPDALGFSWRHPF